MNHEGFMGHLLLRLHITTLWRYIIVVCGFRSSKDTPINCWYFWLKSRPECIWCTGTKKAVRSGLTMSPTNRKYWWCYLEGIVPHCSDHVLKEDLGGEGVSVIDDWLSAGPIPTVNFHAAAASIESPGKQRPDITQRKSNPPKSTTAFCATVTIAERWVTCFLGQCCIWAEQCKLELLH